MGKSHSAEDSFSSLEDIDVRRQNIRSAAAGMTSVYHVILFAVHTLDITIVCMLVYCLCIDFITGYTCV